MVESANSEDIDKKEMNGGQKVEPEETATKEELDRKKKKEEKAESANSEDIDKKEINSQKVEQETSEETATKEELDRKKKKEAKGEPQKLENFVDFERCERCTHIPMFPSHETYSGTKRSYSCSSNSSVKMRSGATTSGNEEISSRLAHFVSNGSFNVKNLKKALDYFRDEESLCTKTWLKLLEEHQIVFLNALFP